MLTCTFSTQNYQNCSPGRESGFLIPISSSVPPHNTLPQGAAPREDRTTGSNIALNSMGLSLTKK